MQQELLIEKVRQYEFLYNVHCTQYRDQNMRYEAWEQIGRDLNITASQAKDIWSKLRNCFTNALKRRNARKGIQPDKKYSPWRFEKQMEFLQPYMDFRHSRNLSQPEDPISIPEEESETFDGNIEYEVCKIEEDEEETLECSSVYQPRKRPNPSEETLENMRKKSDLSMEKTPQSLSSNLNEIDMFYLSMSRTVQKLPHLDQIRIRMELCKIVSEAEMAHLQTSYQ